MEKTNKESKKEKKDNKKIIVIIPVCIILIIISIIFIKLPKRGNNPQKNGNGTVYENVVDNVHRGEDIYEEIVKSLEDKTDVIIYYYDSSTNNKINNEIKDYLNEAKINYSIYDHSKINKEEYHKVMEKLNIDEEVFGMPAIIYMHYGIMYANNINIDSIDTLKRFVEDYKLTEVK